MTEPRPSAVTDHPDRTRFELEVDGQTAILTYRREGDRLHLLHTEVPPGEQGRGVGGALVQGALERARDAGLTVVPVCPFVHAWLQRHPEFQSLAA